MIKRLIPFFLGIAALGFSDNVYFSKDTSLLLPKEQIPVPWFTGPLFAPSAFSVPPSHFNLESYLYLTANTGFYNSNWKTKKIEALWNISFQPSLEVGLFKRVSLQLSPVLNFNCRNGTKYCGLGDFPIQINIQLYQNLPKIVAADWVSAVTLTLLETFPTGKYRNLHPKNPTVQSAGMGSFQSAAGLIWGFLYHIQGDHFFDNRISLFYTIPSAVSVRGFNSYGGGYGTKGTVYPGQIFEIDWGMEFTFTKNWVVAMDILGVWKGKNKFKGNPGMNSSRNPATNTAGSSVQFSLAPAFEYNLSDRLGLISGIWFTIAGRNALQFTSSVTAFNYYY